MFIFDHVCVFACVCVCLCFGVCMYLYERFFWQESMDHLNWQQRLARQEKMATDVERLFTGRC